MLRIKTSEEFEITWKYKTVPTKLRKKNYCTCMYNHRALNIFFLHCMQYIYWNIWVTVNCYIPKIRISSSLKSLSAQVEELVCGMISLLLSWSRYSLSCDWISIHRSNDCFSSAVSFVRVLGASLISALTCKNSVYVTLLYAGCHDAQLQH